MSSNKNNNYGNNKSSVVINNTNVKLSTKNPNIENTKILIEQGLKINNNNNSLKKNFNLNSTKTENNYMGKSVYNNNNKYIGKIINENENSFILLNNKNKKVGIYKKNKNRLWRLKVKNIYYAPSREEIVKHHENSRKSNPVSFTIMIQEMRKRIAEEKRRLEIIEKAMQQNNLDENAEFKEKGGTFARTKPVWRFW